MKRFIKPEFSRALAAAVTIGTAEAAVGVVKSGFAVRMEIASSSGEGFVVKGWQVAKFGGGRKWRTAHVSVVRKNQKFLIRDKRGGGGGSSSSGSKSSHWIARKLRLAQDFSQHD